MAAFLLVGGLACAPATRHAPPVPAGHAPETAASPRSPAPRTPLPGDPAALDSLMGAWIFDRGEVRGRVDPGHLALAWSRSRALARARAEALDVAPPPPPDPAWWSEQDLERPQVEHWKRAFRTRWSRSLETWAENAAPYAPHIRSILREEGIPPELWVLTLLESGFRADARSPAAAVGPWQFLAGTARHVGLILSADRDQRRDWELATRAACRYLHELHDELGEGLLALAAFNCGPSRVRRAAARSRGEGFWTLDLPSETENYVSRALALAEILGDGTGEPYGLDPSATLAYDRVELPEPVRIRDLAAVAGTSDQHLRNLNPSWLLPVTPADGHPVFARVPPGTGPSVELALAGGSLAAVKLRPGRVHRVAPGDTLWGISRRYQVGLGDLREVNGLSDRSVLRPGQTLRIPGGL